MDCKHQSLLKWLLIILISADFIEISMLCKVNGSISHGIWTCLKQVDGWWLFCYKQLVYEMNRQVDSNYVMYIKFKKKISTLENIKNVIKITQKKNKLRGGVWLIKKYLSIFLLNSETDVNSYWNKKITIINQLLMIYKYVFGVNSFCLKMI